MNDDQINRKWLMECVDEGWIEFDTEKDKNTYIHLVRDIAPSAQPEPSEITDEQAILHLQSTGWMQNHDREMYESGLREQLADDSGSYDSLIPCEDAISRRAAIDALGTPHGILYPIRTIEELPSAEPEYKPVKAEDFAKIMSENTLYGFMAWHGEALGLMERQGFVICKKTM